MFKNFSPQGLGVSGRQSELIELALTYGFRGMDVDMDDTYRRSVRSSPEDALKYLKAADIKTVGYELTANLDADATQWAAELQRIKPIYQLAAKLNIGRAYVTVPPGSNRLAYHEFFEEIQGKIRQLSEVLAAEKIRVALNFHPGADAEAAYQFEFIRNVEGFLALAKSLGPKIAGVVVDSWNWYVGDGGMDQLSEVDVAQIASVRFADVPENVEREQIKSNERLLPTPENVVNHAAFLRVLKNANYAGPISVFCHSEAVRGMTRETIVIKTQEALDALYTIVGIPIPPRPGELIDQQAAIEPVIMGVGDRDDDM